MRFRNDERGQSVQIGAVLLFAVVVVAFSSYQAFAVPDQNREVEFNHNQEVRDQMLDFRNAVVSMPGGASSTATAITLGTRYPSRVVAQNPGPPSGTLRTVGTTDSRASLSIRNATASGETGDHWDGTRLNYNTGVVVYDPAYNLYDDAPLTVYEHSLLYNQFRSGTVVSANQTLVDGNRLSLVVVNGSLSRTTTGSTSVDVRPVSSSEQTVLVSAPDSDSPITLNFTSRLPASRWQTILSDEDAVASVTGRPAAVPGPFHAISVKLQTGEPYRLRMTKVGVGSRTTPEEAAYLTDEDGEGSAISRGESREVTLAVRDRLNNPISNASVNGSVGGSSSGSLVSSRAYTDDDGTVTFTYETSDATATGTHQLNFTTNDSAVLSERPFEQSLRKNVSLNVTVTDSAGGGDGGAYVVEWTDPSGESANSGDDFGSCDTDTCTWDVGASDGPTLTLNATLSPAFEGVDVDFALDNSTVGSLSPSSRTTEGGGAATTELTANAEGAVAVLASGNDGSDLVTIEVENVTSDGASGSAPQVDQLSVAESSGNNNYDVTYDVRDADGDLTSVTLVLENAAGDTLDQATIHDTGQTSSVSGSEGLNAAGSANPDRVRVVAKDAGGNSVEETEPTP